MSLLFLAIAGQIVITLVAILTGRPASVYLQAIPLTLFVAWTVVRYRDSRRHYRALKARSAARLRELEEFARKL